VNFLPASALMPMPTYDFTTQCQNLLPFLVLGIRYYLFILSLFCHFISLSFDSTFAWRLAGIALLDSLPVAWTVKDFKHKPRKLCQCDPPCSKCRCQNLNCAHRDQAMKKRFSRIISETEFFALYGFNFADQRYVYRYFFVLESSNVHCDLLGSICWLQSGWSTSRDPG